MSSFRSTENQSKKRPDSLRLESPIIASTRMYAKASEVKVLRSAGHRRTNRYVPED